MVFIAGGATTAELAAIQKVMREQQRDVVVGTTHILSPQDFVHDLQFLDEAKVEGFFEERQEIKRKQAEVSLAF